MNAPQSNRPKLLKARQWHSRLFAILAVTLIIVSEPALPAGQFPRECMMWTGYMLVIAGALGRVYCSAYIGGRKNDTVVRQGPFSVVRNPLYVCSFLAVVGIGLQSGMLSMTALLVIAFLVYYPFVVRKEEAFLRHKFGEAYEAYLREVPRWIPNFTLWNDPEHVDAMPRFIRNTLMDATVFFIPLPCFVIIEALHAHAWLPVWFVLP